MALCPSEAVQLNDNEPLGCRDTLALPIATARIHPHMPRRRKSMSPHRASGCSTPPSAALRRVSYWVTTLDGTSELRVAFDVISEFFYGDRSLDRPRVYIQVEFLPDQLCQLARSNGLASDKLFLNKFQYLSLELVRAAWSPLLRHEPGDPRFVEAGLGLIVSRPRHTVFFRCVGDRRILERHAAQHLVFDLHNVAGVEELAVVEFRIVDLVGCRVQRTLFEEGPNLRMLAVALCGHRD